MIKITLILLALFILFGPGDLSKLKNIGKEQPNEIFDSAPVPSTTGTDLIQLALDDRDHIYEHEQENGASGSSHLLEEIMGSYYEDFTGLYNEVEAQMEKILHSIHGEIGEDDRSLFDLYYKYKPKLNKFEEETDKSFYSLYNELINTLEENGFSPEEALSILEYYNQVKKEQKQQATSEVLKQLFSNKN